ncbi:MAG: hypothetical protein KTR32_21980 [Granulosicoccus sp.]|nr:hypothetical protein [Granulosicoccus sp.]
MNLSIAIAALLLLSTSVAQAQQALPLIVGSDLPGTGKSGIDISIDGENINTTGLGRGGFIPDVDGDGIVEAYLIANEPGQPCETLVYLPSRQARTAAISSSNLSAYTRIRNFGSLLDANNNVVCPDGSLRLRVFGDLSGDGVAEIATLYSYNGELIIDGALPYGTLIDVTNPVPGEVSVVADDLAVNPVDDVNGDGLVDWSIYSYADGADRRNECLIMAGSDSRLPSAINFDALDGVTPLAAFSRNGRDSCPRVTSVGDVNGDGFSDIAIFDDQHWLVHGSDNFALDDNYRDAGYRIFTTCRIWECQQIIDVDADGYDDVLVDVSELSIDSLLPGTGSLVLYGGPDGVLSADAINPLPQNRVTQIIPKFYDPRVANNRVVLPEPMGDINGDSAADLYIKEVRGNADFAGSVLYGTPGSRPTVILEASLDGGNGFYWFEERPFFADPGPGDFDGDGFDELAIIDTLIKGSGPTRRGADPKALFMFNGPDSIDLHWQAPDDTSLVSAYRILVNGDEVAELDIEKNSYRIERGQSALQELRLQSTDASGSVIGELIRSIDLQGTPLAASQEYIRDVEFNSQGKAIEAETYSLTGVSYGPAVGELFWNATKRFVLIWRDGKIIDRVEGNSYVVRDGGEFFITIDYLAGIPTDEMDQLPSSGTLRRSNVVSVNPTDTPQPDDPNPDNPNNTAPPANLTASVYSASTAELFWDRAAPDEAIIAYDIERNGVQIAQSTGTSYLDDTRESSEQYTYSVTAISQDNNRSNRSTVVTPAFSNDGNVSDEVFAVNGDVYSRSAVEIFWSIDALEGELPVRFEVFQNGQSVFRGDARSYFTDNLESVTKYDFEVVGLNAANQEIIRSEALSLTTQ